MRATPKEIRAFFEDGGNRKVNVMELATLKKHSTDGKELPFGSTEQTAYDQIADGIGDGTLTY